MRFMNYPPEESGFLFRRPNPGEAGLTRSPQALDYPVRAVSALQQQIAHSGCLVLTPQMQLIGRGRRKTHHFKTYSGKDGGTPVPSLKAGVFSLMPPTSPAR